MRGSAGHSAGASSFPPFSFFIPRSRSTSHYARNTSAKIGGCFSLADPIHLDRHFGQTWPQRRQLPLGATANLHQSAQTSLDCIIVGQRFYDFFPIENPPKVACAAAEIILYCLMMDEIKQNNFIRLVGS